MTKRASKSGHAATQALIDRMVRRIVRQFDPERVILFGSHARGEASADSDVDLLVVMNYRGSAAAVRSAIRVALDDIPVAKDVLVSTPEQFAARSRVSGTVERPAALEGKVLHERA